MKVTNLIVEYNLPVAVSDHFGSFFKDVFPDSEIAKNYPCGSTKSTCIINGSLAPYFKSSAVATLKKQLFSIAIDGSNNNRIEKMSPLTVHMFDGLSKITTQLLDMCLTKGRILRCVSLSKCNACCRYRCWYSCSYF